jgi:hypothetical protein
MNWKGCARKRWWPNLRHFSGVCLDGLWEAAITSVGLVAYRVLVKILAVFRMFPIQTLLSLNFFLGLWCHFGYSVRFVWLRAVSHLFALHCVGEIRSYLMNKMCLCVRRVLMFVPMTKVCRLFGFNNVFHLTLQFY